MDNNQVPPTLFKDVSNYKRMWEEGVYTAGKRQFYFNNSIMNSIHTTSCQTEIFQITKLNVGSKQLKSNKIKTRFNKNQ